MASEHYDEPALTPAAARRLLVEAHDQEATSGAHGAISVYLAAADIALFDAKQALRRKDFEAAYHAYNKALLELASCRSVCEKASEKLERLHGPFDDPADDVFEDDDEDDVASDL